MGSFNPRRIANPDILRKIRADLLLEFLRPYAEYFTKRGVRLGSSDVVVEPLAGFGGRALSRAGLTTTGIDYEALADVIADPDDEFPADLANGLYIVSEMATDQVSSDLVDDLEALPEEERVSWKIDPESSHADLAIQVWLKDKTLLDRKHAEQYVGQRQTFQYFASTDAPAEDYQPPSEAQIESLRRGIGEWYASRLKGKPTETQIFVYPKPDEIWFVVRHGESFQRVGAIKDGQSTSVFYRPEKHDVLVYCPSLGELRINAGSKRDVDRLRRLFGKHLFSGPDHFPSGHQQYSLEPLRTDGELALVCADVPGIEAIWLTQLEYFRGGKRGKIEIHKADDLLAYFAEEGEQIPPDVRLVGAKFKIKFSDSRVPRTLTLRPSNIARYTRDGDGKLVALWLSKRGFSWKRGEAGHEQQRVVLASA